MAKGLRAWTARVISETGQSEHSESSSPVSRYNACVVADTPSTNKKANINFIMRVRREEYCCKVQVGGLYTLDISEIGDHPHSTNSTSSQNGTALLSADSKHSKAAVIQDHVTFIDPSTVLNLHL